MVVVVPDLGTFDAFERGLTADSLAAMLVPAESTWGIVTLPRFKFATASRLTAVLAELGMAAAATGTTVVTVAIVTPGATLVVDRPFLFFIRHASGAVLFQGRVVDPSK